MLFMSMQRELTDREFEKMLEEEEEESEKKKGKSKKGKKEAGVKTKGKNTGESEVSKLNCFY